MKWPEIHMNEEVIATAVFFLIGLLFLINLGFCGFRATQALSHVIGISIFTTGATENSILASFLIGMALLFIGIALGRKMPISGVLSFISGINGLALSVVCFFPPNSTAVQSMNTISLMIPIFLGFTLANGSRCMAYHMEKRNPPKKKPEREPGMGPLVTYAVLMMLVFVLLTANTQPMSQNGIAPALILGVTMIGAMLAGIVIHSRFLKIPLVLFGLAMLAVNPLLGPPGFIDVLWSRSLLLVLALLCYSFGCHARTLIRSAAAAACARGAPAYVQGTHISSGGGYSGGGGGGSTSSGSNTAYEGGGSEPSGSSSSAIDRVTGTSVYGAPPVLGSQSASSRVDSDGRQTANDGLIPGIGGTHEGTWRQEGSSAVLREGGTFSLGGGSAKLSVDSDGRVTEPGMFGSLDAKYVGKMESDGTIRDSFGNIVGKYEK